jgi:protein-S-isoprenylcysteine O-methyltransferase Ste14
MDRTYLEILFLCGMVLQIILRSYYVQYYNPGSSRHYFNKRERLYLFFIFVGFQLLPLIYVFSTWFAFFDYTLPEWMGIPAAILYCFGVWLFFRAHADLGKFWSPGLELKEDHQLVTSGVFKWVRHPMYAAFVAIAVAQIFMLQNWLIGPAFLISAIPFYLQRVKREEKMLIKKFDTAYLNYRNLTGEIFPRIPIQFLKIPLFIRKKKSYSPQNMPSLK